MWLPLFLLIHRTHTFRTQEPASSVQRLLMRSLAASLIHEVLFCCVILSDSCGLLWFRCAPAFFLSDRHLVWNRFYIVFSRSLSNGIAQVCLDPYGSFAYPGFQVIQILSSCFRFLFLTSTLDAIRSDLLCQSESPQEIQVVYHIGITLSGYNIASVSDFVNSFLEEIIVSFHLFRKLFAKCTVSPCPLTPKGPAPPKGGAGPFSIRAAQRFLKAATFSLLTKAVMASFWSSVAKQSPKASAS